MTEPSRRVVGQWTPGDAGMFGLFLEAQPGEAAAYRFGREPAGTPSPPWTWSAPAPA